MAGAMVCVCVFVYGAATAAPGYSVGFDNNGAVLVQQSPHYTALFNPITCLEVPPLFLNRGPAECI